MLWCVIEYLVSEPFEGVVFNYRQDAERPIIQLITSDVAGKVFKSPIQIGAFNFFGCLFSPHPRPSFGSWRIEQRRYSFTINANWLVDAATQNNLGLRQILRTGNTFRRIRQIFPGAGHSKGLLDRLFLAWNLRHLSSFVMVVFPAMLLKTRIIRHQFCQ
jgi:hypothetical protein